MTTASQMATPPSMAVGFLCQRSVFGLATMPIAPGQQAAPRASAPAPELPTAATARRLSELNGILRKRDLETVFRLRSVRGKLIDSRHQIKSGRRKAGLIVERRGPAAVKVDHSFQNAVELHFWFEADELIDF